MSLKDNGSNSPLILGSGPKSGKKGLGAAKKVNQDFFADFDLAEDENAAAAGADDEDGDEKKEEQPRYSKLAYEDNTLKKSGGSVSIQTTKTSETSSSTTPAQRQQRAAVGSDSFVPTRAKKDIAADKASSDKGGSYGYAQQQFGRAKAISSNQFFADEDKDAEADRRSRVTKFEGARSISSANYFDRNEDDLGPDVDASDVARRLAYTAKTDMAQVKDIVTEGGRKVAAAAGAFFSELSDRYN